MADVTVDLGAVLDITITPRKIMFAFPINTSQRRPSLYNDGTGTIILALSKPACTGWNMTEELDKLPVPPKSAARIPQRCTYVVARTVSGTAKCWFVED
jgi:hypothetical protein